MYEKGLGVTQNYETALKFLYLSRYLGHKGTHLSQEIKLIESRMTGVEIDGAKLLADEWVKSHKRVQLLKVRCNKIEAFATGLSENIFNKTYITHREFALDIGCWY